MPKSEVQNNESCMSDGSIGQRKGKNIMIYGNINAKETEAAYTPVVRKALEILRTTDVSDMHHGKYPLDGDKLILQINEITTGPKETKRPEVHRPCCEMNGPEAVKKIVLKVRVDSL